MCYLFGFLMQDTIIRSCTKDNVRHDATSTIVLSIFSSQKLFKKKSSAGVIVKLSTVSSLGWNGQLVFDVANFMTYNFGTGQHCFFFLFQDKDNFCWFQ